MISRSFLLAALLILAPRARAAAPPSPTPAKAPSLESMTSKALEARLAKASGHPTLVNLWATWCAPCKSEMPELLQLRKEHPELELVLISGDSESDIPEAKEFLAKLGVDFPAYRLTEAPDVFMKPFIKNWPAVVPTTLLFDGKGHKVETWVGRAQKQDLDKKLTAKR